MKKYLLILILPMAMFANFLLAVSTTKRMERGSTYSSKKTAQKPLRKKTVSQAESFIMQAKSFISKVEEEMRVTKVDVARLKTIAKNAKLLPDTLLDILIDAVGLSRKFAQPTTLINDLESVWYELAHNSEGRSKKSYFSAPRELPDIEDIEE